jgi:NCAIR mutase (PurE)-related protein
MRPEEVRVLLQKVAAKEIEIEAAAEALGQLSLEDLGFARLDHQRALRTGHPEVVFGPGKTAEQIAQILTAIAARRQPALVTRLDEARAQEVLSRLAPDVRAKARVESAARMLLVGDPLVGRGRGVVAVVAAGTSDLPVLEEAAFTLQVFGHEVDRIVDVGVAGLHRLLAVQDRLRRAEVLIVIAGMEGALASVVGGLVAQPVIAVPTSVGVGAHFEGVTALLAMLNSCASGVTVVNIDNGFGAAVAAAVINQRRDGDE